MNCSSCGGEMEESTRYDRMVDDLLSQASLDNGQLFGYALNLRYTPMGEWGYIP